MTSITRPSPGEYRDYAIAYVSLVPEDGQIVDHLEAGGRRFEAWLRAYPASQLTTPHAPGEWTPLDVLLHVMDTERVFAYRALCLARGETVSLPGFEQDAYAAAGKANARSLNELIDEYRAVRTATIALVQSFDEGALNRYGTADGQPLSVRAVTYMLAGHELFHLRSLGENYGDAAHGAGKSRA